MTRASWTMGGLALAGGALVAAAVLTAPGASATQGQPVIAGQDNAETSTTVVTQQGGLAAIAAFGGLTGVFGHAQTTGGTGVSGTGSGFGVVGDTTADGGTGVYGSANFPTGIGVHGRTSGSGSAVFGEATGGGVGVNGVSARGIGVEAQSSNGTALRVVGKVSFNRSGIVTVAAGTSSKTVQLGRVTTASMVLATAQQSTAVSVKAAVPGAGKFTIQLTANAPTGGLKVAYFVLN